MGHVSLKSNVMSPRHEHLDMLYRALAQIPTGRVITYGNLASRAGRPGGARWVGKALAALPPQTTLPWHRVINCKGEITCPNRQQAKQRLIDEGIDVTGYRVSLALYHYEL
jgi:methylated-DNA-protein-cysteine methyltransferase-like protein